MDVTDAANILVWAPNADETAAIWHIFRREDIKRLREAIWDLGLCPTEVDPIHLQSLYLLEGTVSILARYYRVRARIVRQRVGDLIVIPAGCAHQVSGHLTRECRRGSHEIGVELTGRDQGGERFYIGRESDVDGAAARRMEMCAPVDPEE